MLVVSALRVLVVRICDVLSCEVLKELYKYVGCGLKSEREEQLEQLFCGQSSL